jgi:tetratricopeptide (TPR) repeat protein
MRYSGRKTWALAGLILLGLAGVITTVRGSGRSDPSKLGAEARVALKNRQWPRAEGLLAQLARQRPPTSDDIVLRAELKLGRGWVDESIALLTGIADSDPLAASARLVAGQIEKSRNRARPAEALFIQASRLDPRLVAAHRELILLYAAQGRRLDLNAQYKVLTDLESLTFDDVFLWMTSFENLWLNDVIRSQLERFLAADPDDRVSRLALAGVLLHTHQLEESESLLRPLRDSDPDARALRAHIALSRMRMDEVRLLLESGPTEHVGLALLRGQVAVRINDRLTAARQFRIALSHDPTNHEALQGLALVLKQLGDREAAASIQEQLDQWHFLTTLLQKSRTFEIRTDKTLLTQLAQTCAALNQIPEARAWYRLALAQDPLDAAIQKSLYFLRGRAP